MSMDHKAFAFEWSGFEAELLEVLNVALRCKETSSLERFINSNLVSLSNPHDGEPLESDWKSFLESSQVVQELADFALTQFYDVLSDAGLGTDWIAISDAMSEPCQIAMLGHTVGPPDNLFDPGRMGSYFQTSQQVQQSSHILNELDGGRLEEFMLLLSECCKNNLGLYVTF